MTSPFRTANSAWQFGLVLALTGVAQLAHGQYTGRTALYEARKAFPNDAALILERSTEIRIDMVDGQPSYRLLHTEEKLILRTNQRSEEQFVVRHGPLIRLQKIRAKLTTAEGGTFRVKHFQEYDSRNSNTFHDDGRATSYTLTNIDPGARIKTSYELSGDDVRFIGAQPLADGPPVLRTSLTVSHPPELNVELRTFWADSINVTTTTSNTGKKQLISLTASSTPGFRTDPGAPSPLHWLPHAQLVVRVPGDAPLSNDPVEALHRWTWRFLADTDKAQSPTVDSLARAITADLTTPLEKAERIFAWVQDHVRYLAIHDGLNGWIPATPEAVHHDRYGDCKGMSSILRAMLRAVDIEAHWATIGSRALPYTLAQLPTNSNSDHMIVTMVLGNDTLFLDATDDEVAFGLPTAFIQGKDALVLVDSENWAVAAVPITDPARNHRQDNIALQVPGDRLVGKGHTLLTGYLRNEMARGLKHSLSSDHAHLVRTVLLDALPGVRLDSFSVEGLADRNAPLRINYVFNSPIPAQSGRHGTLVNLHISDPLNTLSPTADRRLPRRIEHGFSYESVLEWSDPQSLSIGPVDTSFVAHGIQLSAATSNANGLSMHTTTIHSSLLLAAPNDRALDQLLEQWRDRRSKLHRIFRSEP